MKKITISFLFIFFMLSAYAGVIEKTYYFSNPQITKIKGFDKISFGNDMLTAENGNPALPYNAISLLLPPGEEAVSIEITGENKVELKGNYQLWPYQPSRPLSETKKAKFYQNKDIYNSKSVYPKKLYGNLSTQYLNGYAFALSAFTPVEYIPADGKISYYSKITVKITTKPSGKSQKALDNLSSRKDIKERVLTLAQNQQMIKSYPEKQYRSEDEYELLIITKQQYENSFEDLRNIYISRGIRSKVTTVEYINQNITGQDSQEKIRNYIIQEYQNSGTEYVLLGGDVEIVPYRGLYCYVQSGSGYTDSDIPADLYYSALDGNWNNDGDDKWGEPDEDDLLPDIAVARMSFSTSSELQHMIHKSIWYQNHPVLGEFKRPVLAGEWLYSDPQTYGKDYLELLIGEHDDNGYTTIGIPQNYDFQKMYEADGNWSGNDLRNKINSGVEFVHHVGHANATYVAKWTNSDITDANFSGANGIDHNYTIMQTHGCICGSFDNNDCILEKMVSIQNFAVAVIGNSRYGWFNEGQTEGPAAHLHREMVDAMFHEKIAQIGKAFVECKIQTAPWVEAPGQWEEGALRWNFYDINVLGDPAMSVWTDEPVNLTVNYPSTIVVTPYSVNVTVMANNAPAVNYSCVIMKDGELVGMGKTGENGVATVTFVTPVEQPGDASLIVSGYDCLPDTNEITFVPPDGAYVSYVSNEIDDINGGNGNGEIENGETINLNVTVANVGNETANNVEMVLSTESPWVSITDNSSDIGNISSNDTLNITNAFSFNVAENTPDQENIPFNLQISSGNNTWNTELYHTVNAPKLEGGNMQIDDTNGGNGNGMPDPGETVKVKFVVTNTGHNIAPGTNAKLIINSSYITVENNTVEVGDLNINGTSEVSFNIDISENIPTSTFVNLNLQMTTGEYTFSNTFGFTVGIIIEDFESGDFSQFEWNNGGNAPWQITAVNPYEGSYSAKSGNIADEQSSELYITIICFDESEVSFTRKVSSENNYDFLRFFIDDSQKESWSGEKDWQEFSYNVSAGPHTLKWVYEKDYMTIDGQDCAWLDNIVFPSTTTVISVGENKISDDVSVYPNPNNGEFFINSKLLKSNAEIFIYDMNGKIVYKQKPGQILNSVHIRLNNIQKGMYVVKLISDKEVSTEKMIVK